MALLEKRNNMCGSVAARPTVFALAAVALLSGCAGSSPVVTPQSAIETSRVLATAAFNPDAQHFGNDYRFIYTAQLYGNDVSVYRRNGLTLTYLKNANKKGLSAPQGTVTTVNGWWYVANGGDSNVLIYRTKKGGQRVRTNRWTTTRQDPLT